MYVVIILKAGYNHKYSLNYHKYDAEVRSVGNTQDIFKKSDMQNAGMCVLVSGPSSHHLIPPRIRLCTVHSRQHQPQTPAQNMLHASCSLVSGILVATRCSAAAQKQMAYLNRTNFFLESWIESLTIYSRKRTLLHIFFFKKVCQQRDSHCARQQRLGRNVWFDITVSHCKTSSCADDRSDWRSSDCAEQSRAITWFRCRWLPRIRLCCRRHQPPTPAQNILHASCSLASGILDNF